MEEALEQHPRRRKEDRPPRRFRKGMYVLPSLFTTANVALGCYAIMHVIHGSVQYAVAGATRLARFNITVNPQPSNPGRPGKKYFVGMPIPAAAGVIAAVVHFSGGDPLVWWGSAVTWIVILFGASYLMVSTWRFYSFKDIDFRSRQPFRLIVIF